MQTHCRLRKLGKYLVNMILKEDSFEFVVLSIEITFQATEIGTKNLSPFVTMISYNNLDLPSQLDQIALFSITTYLKWVIII